MMRLTERDKPTVTPGGPGIQQIIRAGTMTPAGASFRVYRGTTALDERDLCRTGYQIQVIVSAQFRSWTLIIPPLNVVARARMIID